MRIGIILHGPEIVDVGSAQRIIEIFAKEHEVTARLGGTMGRTAVIDAGLEDVIDISQGLTPSETIIALKDDIDIAILLNHGKTFDTGCHFGRIIASRLNPLDSPPLVHIERPDFGGGIIYYDKRSLGCAEYVQDVLKRNAADDIKYEHKYNLKIEKGSLMPSYIRSENGDKLEGWGTDDGGNVDGDGFFKGTIIRKIAGAYPGENIRLDGIVIGEVTHPDLEIVCMNGKVVELRGGRIKPHGLEKLEGRRIDLATVKVKTGHIRRSPHIPRIKRIPLRMIKIKKDGEKDGEKDGTQSDADTITVAFIDHCAESTFEIIRDADIAITVGDDTTSIASDILTRLGIAVIGIIDGDLDGVLEDAAVPVGSVIIRVRAGYDDVVGREVGTQLMKGKQHTTAQYNEILSQVLAVAEKYIEDIKYY